MSLDRTSRLEPPAASPASSAAAQEAAEDVCPVDRVLGVMQSPWSAKIIWRLAHGPQRFGQLRRGLDSISPKVLTARLRRLEEQGVVARRELDTTPAQMEYSLAAFGRELTPIVEAMAQVAERISGSTCPGRPAPPVAKRSGVRKRTPA